MTSTIKNIILVIAFICLAALPASAAYINFASSGSQFDMGANGDNPGSITFTDVIAGVNMTVTALNPDANNARIYWDAQDGFGVQGHENDEVDKT